MPDDAGSTRAGVVRIPFGGPWGDAVGCSRAVVAGPFVIVSGSTSLVEGTVQHEGNPHGQTVTAFRAAERALEQAGCSLADVVQTRMYLTHISDQGQVARAHSELFGGVRPAATMVQVAGLVDPRMLVEVEVLAYRG